ncbi:MAG: hypothetical protein WAS21_23500 [Geminicoccaceae bacterium]
MTPNGGNAMFVDLRGALRTVPPAIWRNLTRRCQLANDADEKLVAGLLLAHLERCGWEFGHRPLRC